MNFAEKNTSATTAKSAKSAIPNLLLGVFNYLCSKTLAKTMKKSISAIAIAAANKHFIHMK